MFLLILNIRCVFDVFSSWTLRFLTTFIGNLTALSYAALQRATRVRWIANAREIKQIHAQHFSAQWQLLRHIRLKQAVKVIWQKGRIAAAHGRFNLIRQVATMCTLSVHPIQYTLPWTNPSPRPKRHVDQFSRFCVTIRNAKTYTIYTYCDSA